MNIITSNPIITDTYSNLDGKSPTSEIIAFQRFALSKGADLSYVNKKTGKLVSGYGAIDGMWGQKTADAYAKFGADWEASKNPSTTSGSSSPSIGASTKTNTTNTTTGTDTTYQEGSETNKSSTAPKKGLSTMAWVGIGAGVLALGIVIYALTKSKK
jgi:hypothetical protein